MSDLVLFYRAFFPVSLGAAGRDSNDIIRWSLPLRFKVDLYLLLLGFFFQNAFNFAENDGRVPPSRSMSFTVVYISLRVR